MSAAAEEDDVIFCASCGVRGSDDIKLKRCACKLVKYCSVKCQKEHRPKHKRECKKRVAELRDELLFLQPEGSCFGDCPICCLPVSIEQSESVLMSCCSKYICQGCDLSNRIREYEGRLQHTCPFCREAVSSTDEEHYERLMKRIEVNDPVAMCKMGTKKQQEGDYNSAFEYWTKAAALGDAAAHFQLSCLYQKGIGVEKDEKKLLHHTEQAAIGGHPDARNNLGWLEEKNGRVDRAAKHFIIAAKLGYDKSLHNIKELYKEGHISKEDFNAALRSYQAAINSTKSPQREAVLSMEAASEFYNS